MYPSYPLYEDDGFMNNAVIYIMSQATGYKLTSNKELPTPAQRFSMIIPVTKDKTNKPDNNQKYPMYIKYIIDNNNENKLVCKTYLARAPQIFAGNFKFTQINYDTELDNKANNFQYLVDKNQCQIGDQYVSMKDQYASNAEFETKEYDGVYDNYGLWVTTEKQMIDTIIL